MTAVRRVVTVLESAGYVVLPKPLTIAGAEFEFDAVVRGARHSHDLVLIATDQVPRQRLLRLVSGLARSLDIEASRRPVSIVLLGEIAPADRIELERHARVLPISSADPSVPEIEDAIGVLLPLGLPEAQLMHGGDPLNDVLRVLGPSRVSAEHISLIRAATDGPEAVRESLRQYVNDGVGWSDTEVTID